MWVYIKGKSCNSPEENFVKKSPNTFSSAYSKMFRECFFYRTTPLTVFEVSFSITKEYKKIKKKVNGEIAFALISLFHVQVQESCKHVTK